MVVGENSIFPNLSTQLPSLSEGLSSWVVFGYSRAVPCAVHPLNGFGSFLGIKGLVIPRAILLWSYDAPGSAAGWCY